MISHRLKALRERNHYTQTEIAERLGITRSSVNAWELGISVPSTKYVVELARLFSVSADYILEIEHDTALDLSGLDEDSIQILTDMAAYMRKRQD